MDRTEPAVPDDVGGGEFIPRPIQTDSATKQIADQLVAGIAAGKWKPGDRLPGEHALAESYGVSRGTIREVLRILAANNLVTSTRGAAGGTFITLPTADDVARQIGTLIALWYRTGSISVAEVDHAREVLERACVRLAAQHRSEEDLQAIRQAVEDSRRPELDTDEWLVTDLDFHTAISKAAKNGILELAMTAVHLVRPRTNSLLVRALERAPVSEQHWRIYEAIRDQDPDAAEEAFAAHFDHLVDVQQRSIDAQDARALSLPEEEHPSPEVLARTRARRP